MATCSSQRATKEKGVAFLHWKRRTLTLLCCLESLTARLVPPPDYKDKKGPVWTTCYAKPIWLEGGWKTPSISMWMWTAFIYPSVIDLVKPDPLDFFPSPKENSTSPVTGEMFNFTRPVRGFPDATFTFPAHIISKSQNNILTEGGNLVENLASQWRFFFGKPSENIDATGSVAEGCIHWFGVNWRRVFMCECKHALA